MAQTLDLGRRIELVPMDPRFHDISIALYRQESSSGPVFQVHSYSSREGASQRLDFIVQAMALLAGLEHVPAEACKLQFPCRAGHLSACRRVFLEACKVDPGHPVEPRPLQILDKKSNRTVTVVSRGKGAYILEADGVELDKANRVAAVANGLVKLGQMQPGVGGDGSVAFECGHTHDPLVGLLLVRALNVRAVLREQELTASRGVLSAPSAQK
jgi:hypothetical protein